MFTEEKNLKEEERLKNLKRLDAFKKKRKNWGELDPVQKVKESKKREPYERKFDWKKELINEEFA